MARASIEQSIQVDVPVRTAYKQWTQFEAYPRFMDGVELVRQLDDGHLHWKVNVGGIAWTSRSGARTAGVVTFHRLDDTRTKIMLQVDYEPEGVVENVGDAVGGVSARVRGDLERFKEFIEARTSETGAWRGEIDRAHVKRDRTA